jgi:hypothetical protein
MTLASLTHESGGDFTLLQTLVGPIPATACLPRGLGNDAIADQHVISTKKVRVRFRSSCPGSASTAASGTVRAPDAKSKMKVDIQTYSGRCRGKSLTLEEPL